MKIYITEKDKTKLLSLITDIVQQDVDGKSYVRQLEEELLKAETVDGHELPFDVVTMNSTVHLSLDGQDETVTLVYPDAVDVTGNKISVLSPIGTAILGCRKGDAFDWEINGVLTGIQIKDVS